MTPQADESVVALAGQEAEITRLRGALLFYARLSNNRGVGVSPVYNDHGSKARQALGPCPDCGGRGIVPTGRTLMDMDGPYDETRRCWPCCGDGVIA